MVYFRQLRAFCCVWWRCYRSIRRRWCSVGSTRQCDGRTRKRSCLCVRPDRADRSSVSSIAISRSATSRRVSSLQYITHCTCLVQYECIYNVHATEVIIRVETSSLTIIMILIMLILMIMQAAALYVNSANYTAEVRAFFGDDMLVPYQLILLCAYFYESQSAPL